MIFPFDCNPGLPIELIHQDILLLLVSGQVIGCPLLKGHYSNLAKGIVMVSAMYNNRGHSFGGNSSGGGSQKVNFRM